MKLIIQIPCYNESKTLPDTIKDLPKKIKGITSIEYLVIDDGSSDNTSEIAKKLGVHHILKLETNHGLAKTFIKGLHYAVQTCKADIIVNTDGDNQYCGQDIEKLVYPIIQNKADFVIGCRPILNHKEFSPLKKALQLFGSWVLRRLAKINVKDATSGFRAYSRETSLKINLYSNFSHCAESLIQAGQLSLRVCSVDIKVNPKTRASRLFKSIPHYLYMQGKTIFWMFILYRPGIFFFSTGSFCLFLAAILGFRFVYLLSFTHYILNGRTYIPSLILLSIFSTMGISFYALAVISELIKFNRRIAETNLYLTRKQLTQ